jgi:hypothetical protein
MKVAYKFLCKTGGYKKPVVVLVIPYLWMPTISIKQQWKMIDANRLLGA